jgi:hypothetical protein
MAVGRLVASGPVSGQTAAQPDGQATAPEKSTKPAAAPEPEGWAEFKRVYALADGEVLKCIRPEEFPKSRLAFWQKTYPRAAKEQAGFIAVQFIRWKDGEFNEWGGTIMGGAPQAAGLPTILKMTAGVPRYLIEGKPELIATGAVGDWVYREGASPEAIVPRLSEVLTSQQKLPIKLTLRDVVRRAYVATGDYRYMPIADNARGRIILGGRPPKNALLNVGGGGSGDVDEFLKWLGNEVRFPILNEVANPPRRVSWHIYSPDPKQRGISDALPANEDAVKDALQIITEQTGLTFTGHIRKVRVVVVEPAGQTGE